jgi:selT/selW/selH-like putative selenoprotein
LKEEAVRLKKELESRLDATVKLAMAGIGAFVVMVDGKEIFSKREAGRTPQLEELLEKIGPPAG